MKPMCVPALGLVRRLRALAGVPTLVSTSRTVPSGSAATATRPISATFFEASSSEVPGASLK